MHILITGAAGMVGRKLTERLVADGGLNGKPVDRLTLVDIVAPKVPAGFSGKVNAYALDISRERCVAHAQLFSWQASVDQFLGHLAWM